MNRIKVLLVEDEATLAMIIQETLSTEGFDVIIAHNGVEGLKMLQHTKPDILVVDIMMPEMDGFEMVRRIRKTDSCTPVLFLTARSAVSDVVEGFEIGGNDYLRKPFSMLELIVRIKSLVHHTTGAIQSPDKSGGIVRIGKYRLNTVNQTLTFDDTTEQLSHRESEVLRLLAVNMNEVVSSKDILLSLWGDDSPYNVKSLHVFITKLRHKLMRDESVRIFNVRSIGYKMID